MEIGSRIEELLEVTNNTQEYLNEKLFKFIASCISVFDSIK